MITNIDQKYIKYGVILLIVTILIAIICVSVTHNGNEKKERIANLSAYYVDTEQCSIPRSNPFSMEILKIFHPSTYVKCTTMGHLVTTHFDTTIEKNKLQINADIKAQLMHDFKDEIWCCFKEINRLKNDHEVKLTNCTEFGNDFTVPDTVENILVECHTGFNQTVKRNDSVMVYEDGFAFVHTLNSRNMTAFMTESDDRRPSILIIGIDSMSRMNLRRTMQSTNDYLMANEWIEMEGYNKIGDDAFSNVIALLTGLNETSATKYCIWNNNGNLDHCPFIWKKFRRLGYVTAYGEDESATSTFNYILNGFRTQPVDYYLRPFMLAAEKYMNTTKRWNAHHCLGPRHPADYIFDYTEEFSNRMKLTNSFGFFWTNSFSRNLFDSAVAMDMTVRTHLENLERDGIFETSIVFFLSGHGMRLGALHETNEGFLDERLPMLFISIPDWFRAKYPNYTTTLQQNQNRLTSPYDLYLTMQHLARILDDNKKVGSTHDCRTCQTLFEPVPVDRTCEQAGINEHWCTCSTYKIVDDAEKAIFLGNLTVTKLNEFLQKLNYAVLCQKLKLDRVLLFEQRQDIHIEDKTIENYRIKLRTNNNNGLFQATMNYDNVNKTIALDMNQVSRLTDYMQDSWCAKNRKAKKICFCKKMINKYKNKKN